MGHHLLSLVHAHTQFLLPHFLRAHPTPGLALDLPLSFQLLLFPSCYPLLSLRLDPIRAPLPPQMPGSLLQEKIIQNLATLGLLFYSVYIKRRICLLCCRIRPVYLSTLNNSASPSHEIHHLQDSHQKDRDASIICHFWVFQQCPRQQFGRPLQSRSYDLNYDWMLAIGDRY